MKKFSFCLLVILTMAVAACGVKSELARPDASFPRNYPIY